MRKNEEKKAEPHVSQELPAESDLFKYHGDDQNITVMLRILQWCSKYYSDAPDIIVMLRILLMQEVRKEGSKW